MSTSSARPDNLAAYRSRLEPTDAGLRGSAGELRSALDAFRTACSDLALGADLAGALERHVLDMGELDRWVGFVGEAFRAADQGSTASGVAFGSAEQITAGARTAAECRVDPADGGSAGLPALVTTARSVWKGVLKGKGVLDTVETLGRDASRVGRYAGKWQKVLDVAHRIGISDDLLRYKKSGFLQKLSGLGPYAKKYGDFFEKNPIARKFNVVADIYTGGEKIWALGAAIRKGDIAGTGRAAVDLALFGAGQYFKKNPVVLLSSIAYSEWSTVIEESGKVDWSDLPTPSEVAKYGPSSFVDAVGKATSGAVDGM